MQKLILGTLNFDYNYVSEEYTQDKINKILDICLDNGITYIDTASYYNNTEKFLGNYKNIKKFKISSKANPWFNNDFSSKRFGRLNKSGIEEQIYTTLKNLNVEFLDTYYIHAWDPETDIKETLTVFNDLYEKKIIKNMGVSNLSIDNLKLIIKVCDDNNFVKPSVYQGIYNIYCRNVEEIFDFLKENNIKFIAYNALAGGILTGKYFIDKNQKGRFKDNQIYKNIFWNEELISYTKNLNSKMCIKWLLEKNIDVLFGVSKEEHLYNILDISCNLTKEENDIIDDCYKKMSKYQPNYWY
jgi:aflatoxin B1 aldehyde reductase